MSAKAKTSWSVLKQGGTAGEKSRVWYEAGARARA